MEYIQNPNEMWDPYSPINPGPPPIREESRDPLDIRDLPVILGD